MKKIILTAIITIIASVSIYAIANNKNNNQEYVFETASHGYFGNEYIEDWATENGVLYLFYRDPDAFSNPIWIEVKSKKFINDFYQALDEDAWDDTHDYFSEAYYIRSNENGYYLDAY